MHDAFLKSIVEEPHEDANRLVYADWLDDNGDEARAEFIRLQCELAAGKAEPGRRETLKKREAELLAAHGREWAGAAAEFQPEFRRGFVERVTLRVGNANAAAEQLQELREALPTIAGVKIERGVSAERLGVFLDREACRGLRELDLSGVASGNEYAFMVVSAGKPALERLDMSNQNGTGIDWHGVQLLARSPSLRRLKVLNLSYQPIGTGGVRELAHEACVFKLRELDVSNCHISSGMDQLARSANVSELTALSLGGNDLGSREVGFLAESPYLGKLETLNIPANRLGYDGAHLLIASRALHGLRHLDLSGFSNSSGMYVGRLLNLDSEHLEGLARLRSLTIKNNGIDARNLRQLLALPHLRRLQALDVSDNPLGHTGGLELEQAHGLTALRELMVRNCGLGILGKSYLQAATNFPALSCLDIANNAAPGRFAMNVKSAEMGAVGPMTLGMRAKLANDHPQHVTVRE